MAFWKSKHAAPAQSHHFRVDWSGVHSHTVKSVTKPSVEVSEGEYQVGNQKFKYPGVARWNDVTITFVDDKETTRRIINKFISQGWLNPNENDQYGLRPTLPLPKDSLSGELYQPDHFRLGERSNDGIIKGSAMDGIETIRIVQHATVSERTLVEGREATFWRPGTEPSYRMITKQIDLDVWTLKNAWIKSINFGTLDYSSDELINIEVVIAYDYCEIDWGKSEGKI